MAAVKRQPGAPGSGSTDGTIQQSSGDGTSGKGGSKKADGSARVEELQQAVQLELGERLAHVPAGLGKELAACPGTDLRGRVRGLKEAVGREDAAALLQSTPALVVDVHPCEVPARLDALAAAFGTDRKAVVRLCSRSKGAGQALHMLPHTTQQRVEALCTVLQLTPQELLEVCSTYPLVLTVDPHRVLARAAALGEGLGLDPAGVADLCRQSPHCLIVPSSSVVAAVGAVGEAREVSREEAVQVCLGCPSVLYKAPTTIAANARALKQHLGLHGGDLEKCMVLLGIPAEQVAPRLEALPAALGVTRHEARLLLQDWPRILLVKAATVAEGWQELQRAASKQPEWREQIGNWTAATVQTGIDYSRRTRQRVDAVLELDPPTEQLPSLATLLAATPTNYQKLLGKVQSGEYKSRATSSKNPERVIRVQHPGLWRQL